MKNKGEIIGKIIQELKISAFQNNKTFDEGDIFFSLVFKSNSELRKIAKLCKVSVK